MWTGEMINSLPVTADSPPPGRALPAVVRQVARSVYDPRTIYELIATG